MAWNPAQRDLRKPAGFGVFKLCGPAPAAPPIQGGDAVCLRNDDLINGTFLRLADGKIQFSSPTFDEDVSFSAAELQRLDLAWTEADAAPARFFLNNGDQISGKIASLSADDARHRIAVARAHLHPARAPLEHLPERLLARQPFRDRHPQTLGSALRKLRLQQRRSCISPAGRPPDEYQAVLSLPLHQDKPVTLIAEFDPIPAFTPIHVQLFADQAHPQMRIRNGVMLHLVPTAVFVVYNDGQASPPNRPRQRLAPAPGAERVWIKVTYDPADGNAQAWYDGNKVAEITAPVGPKEGDYVLFGVSRPLALRRLAVYCGLPAPDRPIAGAKPGEILSYLSNGDVLRASQVEFADGNFIFTTEFGPMKVSPERVVGIAFPAKSVKPPAAGSAALVETSGSRLGLEVEAITDDFVIGKSPDLGELKLPRRIVKSISFPAS